MKAHNGRAKAISRYPLRQHIVPYSKWSSAYDRAKLERVHFRQWSRLLSDPTSTRALEANQN